MFNFLLYKAGQFIVTILPLNLAYGFGVFLSDLQHYFSSKDRKIVRENLQAVLQTQHVSDDMVRDVFRNFGRYLVEFFRMKSMVSEEYIKENVLIKNIHFVHDAVKMDKGVVFVTSHLGNWELAGAIVARIVRSLLVIALMHKHPLVNRLFDHQRESQGMKVVTTNLALRRCAEALKHKGNIAIVADRDFGGRGLLVDLFGKKTSLPVGAALLSARYGSPIVPTSLVRLNNGKFELEFSEPIYTNAVLTESKDNEIFRPTIEKYIKTVEAKVRQYPTQWLMFRRFWAKQGD